jgi:hypothetical protein
MQYENCVPSQEVLSRKHSNSGRTVGNGVSSVEETTLKGAVLKMLQMSNTVFIAKVQFVFEPALYNHNAHLNIIFHLLNLLSVHFL